MEGISGGYLFPLYWDAQKEFVKRAGFGDCTVSDKVVVIRAAILHFENINIAEADAGTQSLPVLGDVKSQRNKRGSSDIDVLCEENQEGIKQFHCLEIESMTGIFQANHDIEIVPTRTE